ncbi:MAG: hypothetical protein IPG90_06520 [Bacteroidetes bacterium]|nr:hypothetical protein [Bacteroidota bacterium]
MDFYWPRAKLLANTGWKNRFGVMMIDYRGWYVGRENLPRKDYMPMLMQPSNGFNQADSATIGW